MLLYKGAWFPQRTNSGFPVRSCYGPYNIAWRYLAGMWKCDRKSDKCSRAVIFKFTSAGERGISSFAPLTFGTETHNTSKVDEVRQRNMHLLCFTYWTENNPLPVILRRCFIMPRSWLASSEPRSRQQVASHFDESKTSHVNNNHA